MKGEKEERKSRAITGKGSKGGGKERVGFEEGKGDRREGLRDLLEREAGGGGKKKECPWAEWSLREKGGRGNARGQISVGY